MLWGSLGKFVVALELGARTRARLALPAEMPAWQNQRFGSEFRGLGLKASAGGGERALVLGLSVSAGAFGAESGNSQPYIATPTTYHVLQNPEGIESQAPQGQISRPARKGVTLGMMVMIAVMK